MKQSNDHYEHADRRAAYEEAAIDLAKGIALGAVPFLGQAVDAWDTVASAIRLHWEDSAAGKEDAQFDLLLAIIGWVPGPGDGVKKSLRIVNRDPQRYAPVLFDLLRFVLQECRIKTSPEALLAQIFDSAALRAELDEVIAGVKESSAFQKLPPLMQSAVLTVLAGARDSMPTMLGIVETRLNKWKHLQRNSAASSIGSSKPAVGRKPASRDSQTVDGASHARNNSADYSRLGQQSLAKLTNEGLGVSGEHIADYICAYELGWGKDWAGHDCGADGQWQAGKPSASKMGKLSKGGNPKTPHVLYKLTDGANGTGIDAVWRADPSTNNGKLFAIVEAKASKEEDAPKFMRKTQNTRKPNVASKLGVSGLPDPSELLEPIEEETDISARPGKKVSGKRANGNSGTEFTKKKNQPAKKGKTILVQMSKEWIRENIQSSVHYSLAEQVLSSYSRHLFYSPRYCTTVEAHITARLSSGSAQDHAEHAAIHYREQEVKSAANKRKRALSKQYGDHPSLKEEN